VSESFDVFNNPVQGRIMVAARAYNFNARDQNAAQPRELSVKMATVFISRMTVRSVVVREIKNYGIDTVNAFESVAECCEDLRNNPESLLVVDWEHGERAVTKILRQAQGPYRVDTRHLNEAMKFLG
jgi:pyridoxine/pyridoxamine 5'-phosphate oxidase